MVDNDLREDAEQLLEEQFEKKKSEDQIRTEIAGQTEGTVRDLVTGQDIDLKSELNTKEIVAATRLLFMSERYQMPHFTHFVNNFLRLRVSKERKGRVEFIQGLHATEKKEQGKDLTPLAQLIDSIKT